MSTAEPSLGHLHPSCRKAMFRHAEGPVCRECRGEAEQTFRAVYNILKEAWADREPSAILGSQRADDEAARAEEGRW